MKALLASALALSAASGLACAAAPAAAPATSSAAVVVAPVADVAVASVAVTPAPPAPPFVSAVKPGNQTRLVDAAVPFAIYLNAAHNRIHPSFVASVIDELAKRPPTDPENDPHLVTRIEMVIDGDTGALARIGIVKSSGVVAFDERALRAVSDAAPFGTAPDRIRSFDGKVYVQWELDRDPIFACSTMHARPFLLTNP